MPLPLHAADKKHVRNQSWSKLLSLSCSFAEYFFTLANPTTNLFTTTSQHISVLLPACLVHWSSQRRRLSSIFWSDHASPVPTFRMHSWLLTMVATSCRCALVGMMNSRPGTLTLFFSLVASINTVCMVMSCDRATTLRCRHVSRAETALHCLKFLEPARGAGNGRVASSYATTLSYYLQKWRTCSPLCLASLQVLNSYAW